MKIVCNVYFISILYLSQGCRTRAEDEAAARKLNRPECLRPPTAGDSPATRTQSLRRLGQRWPDKLPDNEQLLDGSTTSQRPDSLEAPAPEVSRDKREAKAPAQFLLHLSQPPSSNRHYSRRGRHAKFRRHKRKRSRRQPIEVRISFENGTTARGPTNPITSASDSRGDDHSNGTTEISSPATPTPHEVMTYNGEVPAGDQNDKKQPTDKPQSPDNSDSTDYQRKPKGRKGESHPDSRPVVVTVIACLFVLLISAILIYYLWSKNKKKTFFGLFHCPPVIRKSRDDLNECEECTCCSTDDQWMTSGRSSRSRLSPKPPTPPKPSKPPKQPKQPKQPKPKKEKKVKKQKMPPPPPATVQRVPLRPAINTTYRRPSHLSEVELREIQSRIACILRTDYGKCSCCKCCTQQPIGVSEEPKKRKFKLFRKKKKSNNQLCEDLRCQENKIMCLSNLCELSHHNDCRFPSADTFQDSQRVPTKQRSKRKVGLRIKK